MNPRRTNRLLNEKSPYLLQHAENPVDWHPWGEEAFARAKREDRPVFLSIGYATCHWCHVMAHESFEDETVAALLNDTFVCIKVDREERPDIDGIYMKACQMMTGSGGWPLTIVMTPDGKPFFAATYIPKESRWGRTGLVELIPKIREIWLTRRGEAESAAERTTSLIVAPPGEQEGEGEAPTEELLDEAFAELQGQFDETRGGFGDAPKFPMPHQIVFLLRHWRRTGEKRALMMAETTLHALRRGGIYDHLGFGFHRYSTDRQWLVPHFEKMLYDQALLILAFTEAFQATGETLFARTAREVIAYVLRDLTAPEGGFYTAEDADSEGEEGRFYLWQMEEIRRILGPEEAGFAAEVFGMTEDGNFIDPMAGARTGDNILHIPNPLSGRDGEDPLAAGVDRRQRLEAIRVRLLAARGQRVRPQRDGKILTDWNGLMIAALARAARVLNEPRYYDAVRGAVDFVLGRLRTPEGRLLHRYCDGEAAVTGNLDDHAFLIWGLIQAYEAGFAIGDLEAALALQGVLDARFRDGEGGYFFTPDDGEELLFRPKESHDGAVPSGNAVTAMNLIRLGRMTGDSRREEEALKLIRAFSGPLRRMPSAHAQWMIALDLLAATSCEVVIAGRPGSADTGELLAVLRGAYRPNLTTLFYPEAKDAPGIARIAPFTLGMGSLGERAAAYVCTGFSCLRPVTDPGELAALLDKKS